MCRSLSNPAFCMAIGGVIRAIIPRVLARIYALTLQDRLIRTIALRLASDEEFVKLVERTVAENLSPANIKQAIQMWRADNQHV